MKHTFTNLLTRLCANTPPCFGKRSSQCALRSKSAQFLFSLLLLLVMSIGNAWGTDPQDTYYKFKKAKSSNDTIAPVSGNGGDITLGSNSAATVTSNSGSYCGASYTFAANINNADAKGFSLNINASTTNPAHVFLVLSASSSRTIYLKNGSSNVDQCYGRGAAASPALVELVTTKSGSHIVYASGSAAVYAVRVIYENNDTWQELKGLSSITLDKDKTLASNFTTFLFFRLQDLTFNNDGVIVSNTQDKLRYTVNFKALADGEITLNCANPGSSDRILSVKELTRPETLSSTAVYTTTVKKKSPAEYADHKFDVEKGKEYVIGFSGSGATIKSINFTAADADPDPDPDPSTTPSITAQPSTAYAQYIKDATATALSVTATKEGDGTLTYQWYKSETNSNASGTAIDGATSASYTPSTSATGILYYYCAVTNTEEEKSPTTVTSDVSGMVRVVAAPTHLIENVMATSGSWDSYIVSANAHISNLKKLQAAEGKTLIKSGKESASSPRTPGITSSSESTLDEDDYIYLQFTIEEGYELTITDASVQVFSISNPGKYVARISDNAGTPHVIETAEATVGKSTDADLFSEYDFSESPKLSGTVKLKLFAYNWSDGYRMKSPVYIDGTITAAGAPTSYSITYDCDGASSGCPSNLTEQTALPDPLPDAPTKSGYTFMGWYTNSAKTTAAVAGTALTGNTTMYAKWAVNMPGTLNKGNVGAVSNDMTYYSTNYFDFGPTDASNLDRWAEWVVYLTPGKYSLSTTTTCSNGYGWRFSIKDTELTYDQPDLDGGTNVVWNSSSDWDLTSLSAGTYTIRVTNHREWSQAKLLSLTLAAAAIPVDYTITHSASSNGTYTIQVGEAAATDENTTANSGQTITLAATPASGYGLASWTVMNGETPVEVTGNTFTMPAGNVTVSATFALEPNVYYYKSASHFDGSAYKNPEGNAHDVALSSSWTIVSGGTIAGVTSVVANGATFDDKSNETEKWVTSYIKLSKDDASQNITFTIASGYKATIKMKIGAWSNTPTIYLKKGSDVQAYTGTIGGVATIENNFNELTWSDLSAGVYVLNVANEGNKKNAYISQIDIQTTPVYTLTYDANGGTGTMDNTVGTGTVTLSANAYTKSGCTFQGWATSQDNANAGTVAYADGATDYNLSANTTLYAVWKLNAPTISCAANVVTMSAMSGAAIYYTTDGETTPTSSSTLYDSSSKPQIAANTTFKAIAILENYVSSDVTTQTCEYVAPATVDDLVTIDADYTFTPSAAMTANTLYESDKIIAIGDGNSYSSGLQIKENRAIAFKVANNAKVKVTFTTNGDREMQLGTATADDDNKAYGHSKSSPFTSDVITTGGVVYLTASEQLYMSKLEILYPHTVTYALGDGEGTLPTEGSHYKGDKFNVHDGETDITAPEGKEFSAWNDGTNDYAGGAQYTMGSSNVTLTAQWITALPLPTITFNDGNYTIAGAALDLSTLFSSNSDGEVTYTVKTAGETGAAIDGTNFTATAAGSAVVTASQAATASYKTKSVDATITISAPTEVEGIKMVVDGDLTGNFRTSQSLTTLSGDNKYTIAGLNYTKYIKFSSAVDSWSAVAGPANKYLAYTPTKETTTFYFYVHNQASSAYNINIYLIEEGNATPTKETIEVGANENARKSYELTITKNTEVYIAAQNTNLYFCQVVAVESGDALLQAPAVDYTMNLNKGRLSTTSNTATTLDGLTFVVSSGYSIASSSNISIGTKGTHYVSFTIPEGQTRQLQLTTSNTNKYTVSKTLGDAENQYQPKANNETKNWNLTAGTWYINPQGSNVNITNIAFAAAPAQKTVTFMDGVSTLDTKYVWSGDAVAALDPAPTKSGYRFVKWQLSGEDYNFATPVTEDIVLDAVWQKVWTVTFNSDGGSDVDAAVVDDGSAVAAPADPEKAGNEFAGWYYGDPAAVYSFATLVTADLTLTAHWTPLDDDASISALSYDGNAIDLAEGEEIAGVMTFNVLLPWGETPDKDLISVTKSAESATVGTISYESESKTASFTVTAGDHATTADYAIVFANDVKKGASIIKATIAGGDQQAGFAATGLYGDKGYANTRDNKKLDTGGKFVGVKLLAGQTFAAGDKLFVVTSTAADMGYIELYEEAAGTHLIKATGVRDASAGIEIPSELVGLSEFYIVRKESTGDQAWNGFVDYVEVTREINPIITSFKFGESAATIDEEHKTISIDVPYGTDVTALTPTIEAYGNNGFSYTPEGAQDFSSPVNYTVTDGYSEFNTTYAVTVNVADPSENAYLASLSVAGYALDFNKETTTYNVVLNYGTTVLPAISYEVEETGLAEAEKVEGGVNGATTITVTPQAGAGYEKVYTINFSVSTTPKYVIYDGSRGMTAFSATSFEDEDTHFAWNIGSGITPSADNVPNTSTYNNVWDGKAYTKMLKGFKPQDAATTQLSITVPENYMAKVRLVGTTNNDESMRTMFISLSASRNPDDALNGYIIGSDNYNASGFVTDFLFAGTYYIGTNDTYRLYELSVTLYPIDHSRDVTQGRYGTICLPNGGIMVGATIFEVAYMTYENAQPYKVFFDEVIDGVMEPGMPYIFLPNENVSSIAVTYTDNANASAGNYNGLYGTLEYMDGEALYGKYIFSNNSIFMSEYSGNWLNANRAYIVLSQVPDYVTPIASNRRRVSMGVNGTNSATGMDEIEASETPMKVMIEGQIYIIRGEKMYDVTGKLVK